MRFYMHDVDGKFIQSEYAQWVPASVADDEDLIELFAARQAERASSIGAEQFLVLTREHLLEDPDGRRALEQWEARDDSEYEAAVARSSLRPV